MARFGIPAALAVAGLLAFGFAWDRLREARIVENEAKAVEGLQVLAAAELDFK